MGKGEASGKGSGEGWGEGLGKGCGHDPNGPNEWKHGICGNCSPCGNCCLTCCCPPIGAYLLADKMGLEGPEYKYLPFLDFLGFGGLCTFISTMLTREKVRERYGIDGSTGGDCITSFCCTSCAICQMTNQIDPTVE